MLSSFRSRAALTLGVYLLKLEVFPLVEVYFVVEGLVFE